METKMCTRCGETKETSQFALVNARNSFRFSKGNLHTYCKACNNSYAKEFRKKNPGYQGTGRIKSVPLEDRVLMSAIRSRLKDAKSRCVKFKRPVPELTDTYLYETYKSQGGLCRLTGVALSFEKDSMHSLSLDQVYPGKGYIEGNVQWLSWAANRAKGEMSTEVFLSMCEDILVYQKVQRLSKGTTAEAV